MEELETALINTLTRIVDKAVTRRIKDYIKESEIISEEQVGYMEGHSTMDQV